MDTIIDLLERAVARPRSSAGADHQAWLQDADLDLRRYRPPGPARCPGAARSRRAAGRSGPDLGRQPPGVGHRLPRRAVGGGRARAGGRPLHGRAGHQDRGADRRQAGARLHPHHQGRQPAGAAGADRRVTGRRGARRAAAPPPQSRPGRAGRDRLHLRHHRRPEGRHAQPPQHHLERGVAAERGAAGARDAAALDPAAVAHVRAEPRPADTDAGRRIGRVSDQPPGAGAGTDLPRAQGHHAAGGAPGREAAEQRRGASGRRRRPPRDLRAAARHRAPPAHAPAAAAVPPGAVAAGWRA